LKWRDVNVEGCVLDSSSSSRFRPTSLMGGWVPSTEWSTHLGEASPAKLRLRICEKTKPSPARLPNLLSRPFPWLEKPLLLLGLYTSPPAPTFALTLTTPYYLATLDPSLCPALPLPYHPPPSLSPSLPPSIPRLRAPPLSKASPASIPNLCHFPQFINHHASAPTADLLRAGSILAHAQALLPPPFCFLIVIITEARESLKESSS
jgi:hypothetical protein